MKKICLSFDNCAWSRPLTEEEYKTINFNAPFGYCEECNYISLIVKDDFVFEEQQDIFNILSIVKKVYSND